MIIRNSNIHIRNIIVYENCKAIWLNCHICILATCLALTSCLSTVKGEKHKHFWYGSAPFEKRQTLEAYKRDTLPAIERFQTRLSQAGAGVFKRDGGVSDRSCGKTMLAGNIGIRVVGAGTSMRPSPSNTATRSSSRRVSLKKSLKNMITVTLPCHGTMLEMVVLYL